MRGVVAAAGIFGTAVLGLGVWWVAQGPHSGDRNLPVKVKVPELGGAAKGGAKVFMERCATCHGAKAAGAVKGPPLIHKIYEPSHHADFAFYRAVRQGVRAHHWNFGDMPAVKGLSDAEIDQIVAYVRTLQHAHGIGG